MSAVLRRGLAAALLSTAALGAAACGSDEESTKPPLVLDGHPTLVLQVSRSLGVPITACAKEYAPADVRVEVGSPGEIEARLRQGRGDVVASDDSVLPQRLADGGVLEAPQVFARDTLVLAVPADDAEVRDFSDLTSGDSRALIGIGDDTGALGATTTTALEKLDSRQREAVLARVRTRSGEARSLVSAVRGGRLDAAIVHDTDVEATRGALSALPLPAELAPEVTYTAAVAKASEHAADAAALLQDLQSGTCAGQLRAGGFLAP
ncbi:substrate-binding domain-containing protein [Patulibacter sp.]|uniref:substrate-binding domain-containing protein n=1 Tax=Patulibacter sp. TaxID=1912859 RepID=UPI00271BC0FE|nr:substrate-binding domain-containing protein [Patulibacter sp.]MDO9408727.1 substrate-binding domain-containing protein [Patulibacter sp.]